MLHVATKMRSGPSAEEKLMATLPEGGVVDVVGSSGEWLEIRDGEKTGFILGCLATTMPAKKVEQFQAKTSEAAALYGEYEKARNEPEAALEKLDALISKHADTKYYPLALRAQFRVRASVEDKNALDSLTKLNKFCSVRIDTELVDEARKYAAKTDQMNKVISALSTKDERTAWIAVNRATLREAPSTNAESLGTLSYGTKVQVTQRLADYVEVQAGDANGWISSNLTTGSKPLTVAGSYVIKAEGTPTFERIKVKQSGRSISGTVVDKKGREIAYKGTVVGSAIQFKCDTEAKGKGCSFKGTLEGNKIKGTWVESGWARDKEYQVTLAAK